jgi:hypothetical protein
MSTGVLKGVQRPIIVGEELLELLTLDLRHPGRQRLQAALGRGQAGDGPLDHLTHRLVRLVLQGLGQVAGPHAGGRGPGAARVGLDLAQDDLEQRGFSAAVGTHQGQPLAGIEGKADPLENQVVAKRF